jgi:hypothetical protein
MHHLRRPSSAVLFALVAVLAMTMGACDPSEPAAPDGGFADLVLRGGKIVTLDEAQPEVAALAARGGEVIALGTAEEIAPLIGESTRVIELGGALATPGFIEGHGHFLGVGQARMQLNLMGVESWDAVIRQVEAAVAEAEPGAWILGRGWHQEKWNAVPQPNVEGLPVHDALSAVSPDNPVVLEHASGHAVFANAKAMELAGVTADTAAPEGGEIVHDATGRPIGYFGETAAALVERSAPPTEAEQRRMVELASEECLSKGITSFQDAGSPVPVVNLLHAMAEEGALPLRLWVMLRDSNDHLRAALPAIKVTGAGGEHFTVGGIKHWIDGALGSHGAWLLEPYSDMPDSTGLNTTPIATIEESAGLAKEYDLQLCVHAIGDRANRETLDIFERALGGEALPSARRWRVEHAQHLNPADIPRFAELGVIASMQAVHCTSDGPWVPERLGDQRSEEGAYVWRSLMEAGARVTNGTDAPVEDVDPLPNFYAAATRRLADGSYFYPDQKMTREEALRAYTLNNAYAAFEEGRKGSLGLGKLADITVLSRDILTVPDDEILGAKVLYTIVGGKVAFERPSP